MTANPDEWPELVDLDGDGIPDTTHPTPGRELVRRRDAVEHGTPVDAELVDEDEPTTAVVRRPVQQVVRPVFVAVRVVRESEPTMRAGKAVLRNVAYVPAGLGVVLKRLWEAKTNSLHQRMIRRYEAAGDFASVTEWERLGELARERRHRRRMATLRALRDLPIQLGLAALTFVGVLLIIGLMISAANDWNENVFGPMLAAFNVVAWVVTLVGLAWGLLAFVFPFLLVGTLWHIGRQAKAVPGWLHAHNPDDQSGALITADTIVRALQHLNIPPLNKAFKDGWIPPFELPPTREGQGQFRGYRAIWGLPEGVTPGMIADKRDVFANNISRISMEVWPSDFGQQKGGKARHVNLYVADRGVMDKPTPEYPLMHDGGADVFEGVPTGITQRGDLVMMPMVGSNFVFGGQPGQGKSNAVRVVFAGAALDPLCELRVHVFAGNGDFDAYQPRLSLYQKGADPEHAAAATLHLESLLLEVERRENRLADLGAKKLTRPISQQHKDMRPLLVGFSECHELFGDKESGELAADLAVRVTKRGRKTGVMLGFDTQSSRASAIPSQLVENIGVNGCFSVKTWRNNDGFLGDGSFAAGIRATELRFNVDRGTMLMTGVSDELFEIVRTFFIEVDDDTGWDAATEIIERAVGQLAPRTSAGPAPQIAEARDLLADVAEVIGDQTIPAAKVPALLMRAWPNYLPYRNLDGKALVKRLKDEHGVRVPSTDNRWPVSPRLIGDALVRRAD